MIRSFRHKGLKRLFENGDRSKLPPGMVERIRLLLLILDEVKDVDRLNVPGFHLHALKGELKGFHAITVRANWRIIFRFDPPDADDVDFLDYH